MENRLHICKGIITAVFAYLGDKLGILCPVLFLLAIFMLLDYVSGMLAAKKEALEHPNDKNYGWSSKKGTIGIYKKVGYILTVLVALATDYLIIRFVNELGIQYERNTTFGLLVLVWLIVNEMLSVLENAGRMGVKLPKFLVKALSVLKKEMDKKN